MRLEYIAPTSVDEALERLQAAGGRAALAAGGTDLIPALRAEARQVDLVIDLGRLAGEGARYSTIRLEQGTLCLGAGVTHTQVIESALVQQHLPALAAACAEIGGPPVRNRGTLGGNLANASPAADSAPPLLAYDAGLLLVSPAGERRVALQDFFLGPRRTLLKPDELILEIGVPLPPAATAASFIKLGRRSAMAIAVVSAAARLSLDESGRVSQARLALGSVAPIPLRAFAAEQALQGQELQPALLQAAAELARQAVQPISDVRASAEYRSRMVEVLSRRALHTAWEALQRRDPA